MFLFSLLKYTDNGYLVISIGGFSNLMNFKFFIYPFGLHWITPLAYIGLHIWLA